MRQFILGTDWWTDCDDAVAVRLLANAHKKGDISLLGISIDACMPDSVPSLDAFLRLSGLEIPIGLDSDATDFGGKPAYQHRLATEYPSVQNNATAEKGVTLYRRLLAQAQAPVDLLEIGFPQVLAALLESGPDSCSPQTGLELVRTKVRHLWMMAGKWDEEDGCENNFARNRRASVAAAKVCRDWPTPMTFLGWEVGHSVISGGKLPEGDPLHQVLLDHGSPNGRSSWDPMLALLALAESPGAAGYDVVTGKASVNPENGHNFFTRFPEGPHRFVLKRLPDNLYADDINNRIAWMR